MCYLREYDHKSTPYKSILFSCEKIIKRPFPAGLSRYNKLNLSNKKLVEKMKSNIYVNRVSIL